jgi:hypothetical protein
MKGVIAVCLGKLVVEKFGADKWKDALEAAGFGRETNFLPTDNIDDQAVMKVVDSVCKVLSITPIQAADAFGEYWVNTYAPKIYGVYFRKSHSAKELLQNMDDIHVRVTATVANAHPPRFEYDWKNDKTLVMKYVSKRGLIDFLVGLIKGVGKYYNENLTVVKKSNTTVQVNFP